MGNIRKSRSRSGAVLAEGVVSLWLIIVITVAAVSLLTNAGMSIFYKQKISFIAMQTAIYTAGLPMNVDRRTSGEAMAKKLITSMGMSERNAEIQIKDTTVEGAPAVSVRITIANLPLLQGQGGMLPLSVTLGDEATAINNRSPEAYIWLNNHPKMSGYLIPVVRLPPGGVQAAGLPVVTP
ncbi:MAG TPA: hypothetical protein VFA15_06350 [Nitrososphaera sp.]|nr:hypothetical protein [Nitrososphaera sp.]